MDPYSSIPPGYYLKVMSEGWKVQRFWHWHKLSQISMRIPDDSKLTILDLGCGPGSFFFQHEKNGKRIGVDFAQSQIDYARKMMPSAKWICMDVEKEELPKADYIVFSEVLEHLQPDTQVFKKIYSALNKNGKLILTTPNYSSFWPIIEKAWDLVSPVKYDEQHINPQTPKKLKKLIESNGFRLTELKTIFLFTPFVAFVSEKLAQKLTIFEQKIVGKLGYVMIAVCEKK